MKDTVKSAAEISRFFSQGKRFNTPYVSVLVLDCEQHDRPGRVAVIAGKKLGGAVARNANKRRIRALLHDLGGPWSGYDIAFIAKPALMRTPYSKVCSACFKALEKVGLVNPASR